MTPEEFRHQNALTYEEYKRVRETYGHVGSFAYWPDGFSVKDATPIVADSETDFDKRLKGHLQKGVVILGTNYGVRPYTPANDYHEDQQLSVEERQAKLTKYYDLQNQYAGPRVKRAFSPEFETHNGQTSVLSGAYMTDLFKFNLDEEGKWLATGIATKEASDLAKYLKDNPAVVDLNLKGLRHELQEVLGAGEQFVLVMLGGAVQGYADRLQAEFPQALLEKYPHYAAYQYTAEEFQAKGKQLNEDILAGIAKW